jgi:hypothetical protein
MENKTVKKEISGWYVQEELTASEKAAQMKAVERWYEKRTNYRTVPVEIRER